MFDSLLNALSILIKPLLKIDLEKRNRGKFAQNLIELYKQLKKITTNGNILIDSLSKNENPKDLAERLIGQNRLIQSIENFYKQEKLERVLDIKLPEIEQINILWNRKRDIVYIAQNEIKAWEIREENPENLILEGSDIRSCILGDEKIFQMFDVSEAKKQLQDIDELALKLRRFINQNFTIDDLL